MKKARELLKLVNTDSSLEKNVDFAINDQVRVARSNSYCRQLTVLARNSESVVNSIINAVHEMSDNINNDFRICSLILVLSDADVDQAIELSREFVQRDDFRKSKLMSTNILLKESLYGNQI